jgi:tetratricopeptide (TPR) repeat protein
LVAYGQGDYTRAAALHEEALALLRALGDTRGIAASLDNLGLVAQAQGDYTRAATLHEEALALLRALGDTRDIAASLANLGAVAGRQGDHGRAADLLEQSLLLSRDVSARDLVGTSLESLAWVAVARGRPQQAARLGGGAEALLETLSVPLPPEQQAVHDRAVQAMRAALGEDAFAAAWAEGRALPLEEVIALALERGEATEPGPGVAEAP